MDWLKLDAGIHGNAKIWRAATDAGLSVPSFIGHYTGLLCHLARQESPDGHLASIPDSLLEHSMMWDGEPGALARVIRDHFEESNGCLAGWTERNGSAMKEAKADRERKRLERLRAKREKDNPPDNPTDNPPESLPHERTDVRTDVRTDENTTTTTLPAPRKPRASRASQDEGEKVTWITPYEERWKKLGGPTSWDRGPALREFGAIRKHYAEDEILRRLDWYFENKGSEAVLPPEQMERRNFVPTPRDFRLRFERFDPSAAADEREVQEPWAKAVHDAWIAGVGQMSPFRIRNELRRFVELYPNDEIAQKALLTALKNYLEHCRRKLETPRWPGFASNIVGHLPPHLILRPAEAA